MEIIYRALCVFLKNQNIDAVGSGENLHDLEEKIYTTVKLLEILVSTMASFILIICGYTVTMNNIFPMNVSQIITWKRRATKNHPIKYT